MAFIVMCMGFATVRCGNPTGPGDAQRQLQQFPDMSPSAQYVAYYQAAAVVGDSVGIAVIDRTSCRGHFVAEGGDAPAWSPDGHVIAGHGLGGGIFIADVESREIDTIVQGSVRFPRWSPDGRKIVYERTLPPGESGVWYVSVGDSAEVRIVAQGRYPDWSRDGERVVYSIATTDGRAELWSKDLASGEVRQLTHASRGERHVYPKYSPSGTYLLYCTDDGVRVLTVESGAVEIATDADEENLVDIQSAGWIDDETIVVAGRSLRLVERDGGERGSVCR